MLSFPSTSNYILDKLAVAFPNRMVICYTNEATALAQKYQRAGYETYNIDSYLSLINKIVPLVKNSELILCDNYYAFLASIDFEKETKVVQLWHANGALKTFGLKANYVRNASEKDIRRYRSVYQKFTHYMVSSQRMADIFAKNYQQKIEILPFGYPLTDCFFSDRWLAEAKEQFNQNFAKGKKTVLYVPTYRESATEIPLDFKQLTQQLGNQWQVLVKAHPHDQQLQEKLAQDTTIIVDFKGLELRELLPFVDCLITDYSSVPFEYSLANPNGRMIFFSYDLEKYQQEVGLEDFYFENLPGPIIHNQEALIQAIFSEDRQNFADFNKEWNEYAQGKAMTQLEKWVKHNGEN